MPAETLPSDPAPQTQGTLPGFKFNLGHQETDRIIDEIEQVCKQVRQSAGESWMTADAAANIVCSNLGYEDQAELEDALKCQWGTFLESMPHLETKIQDDGSFAEGKLVFRMKPFQPLLDRKMFIKTFKINNRQDLWRICHKAPSAVLEIPEMEFEIGADAKRKIDSIYNHLASAIYNLSMHLSTLGSQLSEDHRNKIGATIEELNVLLDVEKPFTIMLHDRTGLSDIQPEDGVETQYGGAAEEDPIETEERKLEEMMFAISEEDEKDGGAEDMSRLTVTDVD
eukprot:764046-Hanusia_phi.AAC.10